MAPTIGITSVSTVWRFQKFQFLAGPGSSMWGVNMSASHNLSELPTVDYKPQIRNYVVLRTPTKGYHSGTYDRRIRESQRAKGLRSKLSPEEGSSWVPLNPKPL